MSWVKRKRLPPAEYRSIENLALRHVYTRKDNKLARDSHYRREMLRLYGPMATHTAIEHASNIRRMVDPDYQPSSM